MTRTELIQLQERASAIRDVVRDVNLAVSELRQCHDALDEIGAPNCWEGVELSLIGRIRRMPHLQRRGANRRD